MIAALRGNIIQKNPGSLVLDVAGVGYEVLVSLRTWETLPELNREVQLLVQTIVREDAITLYGFVDAGEKALFMLLLGVSGIGPRLALTVLGGLGAAELQSAIVGRDLGRLTSVSGVGKKTAERICVELAEKVGNLGDSAAVPPGAAAAGAGPRSSPEADTVSALVNLGYSEQQVWPVLRALEKERDCTGLSLEEWLRLALRRLAR